MQRKRVGIVLFEDIEVLDFAGPFEVFSTTRLDEDRRREEALMAALARRAPPSAPLWGRYPPDDGPPIVH